MTKSNSKKEGKVRIAKEVKQMPIPTTAEPKTPEPTKKAKK